MFVFVFFKAKVSKIIVEAGDILVVLPSSKNYRFDLQRFGGETVENVFKFREYNGEFEVKALKFSENILVG
jgi:hypothetical protein